MQIHKTKDILPYVPQVQHCYCSYNVNHVSPLLQKYYQTIIITNNFKRLNGGIAMVAQNNEKYNNECFTCV